MEIGFRSEEQQMEITYFLGFVIFAAVFAVFAFLAFRKSRRAEIESEATAGEVSPPPRNQCYECLGASHLSGDRMSECASACGIMPE
jgi:hypothetical protein